MTFWTRSRTPTAETLAAWPVVTWFPGAFDDFVALAGGSTLDVHRFAQDWGPLGICQHGLPAHRTDGEECPQRAIATRTISPALRRSYDAELERRRALIGATALSSVAPEPLPTRCLAEAVADWLRVARAAASLLELARLIERGERCPSSLWSAARMPWTIQPTTRGADRDELENELVAWTECAQLHPFGGRHIEILHTGLFAAIAITMAERVAEAGKGGEHCSACNRKLPATSRAPHGTRRCCKKRECIRKLARERKRKQRALEAR